jgi:hypothetical protein
MRGKLQAERGFIAQKLFAMQHPNSRQIIELFYYKFFWIMQQKFSNCI